MAKRKEARGGREGNGKVNGGKRDVDTVAKDTDGPSCRRKRRSQVLRFVDCEAVEAGSEEDDTESDGDSYVDDFINDSEKRIGVEAGTSQPCPFVVKKEPVYDDFDNTFEERYGANQVTHAGDCEDVKCSNSRKPMAHPMQDYDVWKVKCMVGQERQLVLCLIQKFYDIQNLAFKLPVISAFALDHLKGYLFIEAEKESHVIEACKGFYSMYSTRIVLVPKNEVHYLLSAQHKYLGVREGMWVRMKYGIYKDDLAEVVCVAKDGKKATVKLIPRVDLQALSQKIGGGAISKQPSIPSQRLIRARELDHFQPFITSRRDRLSGEVFDFLDGLMLKGGYLYKKVPVTSLRSFDIQPSDAEIQKFKMFSDNAENVDQLSSCHVGKSESFSRTYRPRMAEMVGTKSGRKDDKFDLHDFVFFGQKDFGVIVGKETGSFKILRGGGTPEVVIARLQDIKHQLYDKLFTASDKNMTSISIGDTVEVLDGSFKGRRGLVKHLYRGSIFVYDEKELEDGGYLCIRSELCEKVEDISNVAAQRESDCSDLGMATSQSSPSSSRHSSQNKDTSCYKGDYFSGPFSVGKTLRLRLGPFKGYLCRVVALYRNDATVKLLSQGKVFKVSCDHLSESRHVGSLISSENIFSNTATQISHSEAVVSDGVMEATRENSSWKFEAPSVAQDIWDASLSSLSNSNWSKPLSGFLNSADWERGLDEGLMSADNGNQKNKENVQRDSLSAVDDAEEDHWGSHSRAHNSLSGWSDTVKAESKDSNWNEKITGRMEWNENSDADNPPSGWSDAVKVEHRDNNRNEKIRGHMEWNSAEHSGAQGVVFNGGNFKTNSSSFGWNENSKADSGGTGMSDDWSRKAMGKDTSSGWNNENVDSSTRWGAQGIYGNNCGGKKLSPGWDDGKVGCGGDLSVNWNQIKSCEEVSDRRNMNCNECKVVDTNQERETEGWTRATKYGSHSGRKVSECWRKGQSHDGGQLSQKLPSWHCADKDDGSKNHSSHWGGGNNENYAHDKNGGCSDSNGGPFIWCTSKSFDRGESHIWSPRGGGNYRRGRWGGGDFCSRQGRGRGGRSRSSCSDRGRNHGDQPSYWNKQGKRVGDSNNYCGTVDLLNSETVKKDSMCQWSSGQIGIREHDTSVNRITVDNLTAGWPHKERGADDDSGVWNASESATGNSNWKSWDDTEKLSCQKILGGIGATDCESNDKNYSGWGVNGNWVVAELGAGESNWNISNDPEKESEQANVGSRWNKESEITDKKFSGWCDNGNWIVAESGAGESNWNSSNDTEKESEQENISSRWNRECEIPDKFSSWGGDGGWKTAESGKSWNNDKIVNGQVDLSGNWIKESSTDDKDWCGCNDKANNSTGQWADWQSVSNRNVSGHSEGCESVSCGVGDANVNSLAHSERRRGVEDNLFGNCCIRADTRDDFLSSN